MPHSVALLNIHVVHVYWHPHIGCGVGNLVIHILVDDEIVSFRGVVLYEVYSRSFYTREIKLGVVVFVVFAPVLQLSFVCLAHSAIVVYAHERGSFLHLCILVEFNNAHLFLRGSVAHLRETNVGFANPALNGMRFNSPAHHLSRLVGRQNAAQHIPAVLCQYSSVEKLQFGIAAYVYHALGIINSHCYVVPLFEWHRVNKLLCSSIVICFEALKLLGLFAFGQSNSVACSIAWKAV